MGVSPRGFHLPVEAAFSSVGATMTTRHPGKEATGLCRCGWLVQPIRAPRPEGFLVDRVDRGTGDTWWRQEGVPKASIFGCSDLVVAAMRGRHPVLSQKNV